jgi:hypothetical protein
VADNKGVLFVPYQDTLGLLSVEDALKVCEDVYRMHARGSVVWSNPHSFKLDVADDFNNHWHVKSAFLKEVPTTGVRIYNYYDDGVRNTVGGLDCTRYIALSDPHSGKPLAIVDEHWSYAARSHRLQMGGPEESQGARPRRHRHHGDEFAALPFDHVRILGDPLHLATARDAARLRRPMVARTRHPGRAEGYDRGGRSRCRHRGGRYDVGRHRQP